jgi:Mrp family chromosome partitioning ATPase
MTVRFEAVRGSLLTGRGFGPELIAFHQPDDPVSVQYRSLVAEIVTQLPGAKPRMLLLVAAKPSIGATTVALNLGVTIARQDGIRVILVDTNFAQPDIAPRLGLAVSPGLRDVIARQNPLAWSIQETLQSNLFALTAGRDDAPPPAALAPIIEQLRSRHDWIVVDGGPWDERLVPLAEACDAVYLIHAENNVASHELIGSILNATGRLRGCIITRR